MKNNVNLKRLVYELNRTLGITSDIERDNLIRQHYNQGLISYRQMYLLHNSENWYVVNNVITSIIINLFGS